MINVNNAESFYFVPNGTFNSHKFKNHFNQWHKKKFQHSFF